MIYCQACISEQIDRRGKKGKGVIEERRESSDWLGLRRGQMGAVTSRHPELFYSTGGLWGWLAKGQSREE